MRLARLVTTAVTAGLLGLPVVALSAAPAEAASPFQTRITMTRTPAVQLYNSDIKISADLEGYNNESEPAEWIPIGDGEILNLERKLAGKLTWVKIAQAAEDETGHVSFTTRAVANASYRVSYAGGDFEGDPTTQFQPSVSAAQAVKVARALPASKQRLQGVNFRYFGKVLPRYAKKPVILQKKLGGAWKTIDRVTTNRRGQWSFVVAGLKRQGVVRYRAFTPATKQFIKSYAPTFTITTY